MTTSDYAQKAPAAPAEAGAVENGREARHIEGFIPVAEQRVRLYTWQFPVRVAHWTIFASVVVLSVTGFYIGEPFLLPPGGTVMTSMRFVHMLAAFAFVAAGLVRAYWLFAGNRFARWTAFIPTTRTQARETIRQLGWYLFLRRDAPKVLGHNQLAAATYMVVFFLFLVQTVTGFALAGLHGTQPWAALFGWVPSVFFGVQGMRFIHHLVMWLIIGFVVHHVYSALLVDRTERNGLMSSIFSGYKFVTRQEVAEARDGGTDVEEVRE